MRYFSIVLGPVRSSGSEDDDANSESAMITSLTDVAIPERLSISRVYNLDLSRVLEILCFLSA